MTRLFDITKRFASVFIIVDSLGESGVVDFAGMFEFTLTSFYKAYVSTKLELECPYNSIYHCMAPGIIPFERYLLRGCSLEPVVLYIPHECYECNHILKNIFGRERAAN